MPRRGNEETAAFLRRRFDWLSGFTDDELLHIAMCEEGESLREGEEYFDLSQPERGIFRGQTNRQVPEGSCLVARSDVDPETWQKLTGLYSSGFRLGM